jgi:lipopolysaccharide export system ATP-binding protein
LLAAEHLARSRGFRDVVSDVSLQINRGEAVALLGPNGAGKTTVFQMIVGVIAPDRGCIYLDGEDITALPVFERARRGLNYLPQDSALFRGLSVEQNILLVLEAQGCDSAQRHRLKDALLERFGLKHVRHVSTAKISGGERRRCEIARLLATGPSFILLDEPFAKLDPIAIQEMRGVMKRLISHEIGVLVTDHNLRETLASVDRAYIINSGRILTHGTPAEIAGNPEVRRLYGE